MFANRIHNALTALFRKRSDHRQELKDPFHFVTEISEVHDFFRGCSPANDPSPGPNRSLPGYCYVCDREVLFAIDRPRDGSPVNWRETLTCPNCRMMNRWRGSVHLFESVCGPGQHARIYITEALTPVADCLRSRYPALTSSEYVAGAAPGALVKVNGRSIRNEDVTRLSFEDGSFDAILTFDVLEHVPDYRTALEEFYRVLDDGGHLIVSVPFTFRHESVTRATLDAEGRVHHLMEPCYHGDPMSDEGVLAFYEFGMELLGELRETGFAHNSVALWNMQEWGYIGANVAFVSRKAG